MTVKLFVQAIAKFVLGAALVGGLIFGAAGTLHYWQGWLLMAILFIPMFLCGLVLMAKNPALLRSRLEAREQEGTQRRIIALSGLMFAAGFVLAGLAVRLGWYMLPRWVSLLGAALFLLSYGLYGEVLRENTFLSRTVRVQENQTVVDTGLYGLVRHPMYAVTLVLFLSMPLVLGSPRCLLCFLLYPAFIVGRIRSEEQVLERELKGYTAYKRRVKYRLIPFVW